VEADGSACFEGPALRSLVLVARDAEGLAVKRMQSFLRLQPGETVGCVGCHENRTVAGFRAPGLLALHRPPSRVEPIFGTPDVFDLPRDIQPILDRLCLSCHDYEPHGAEHGPRAGGVILAGDRGPFFSHSFWMLTVRRQFSDGRNLPRSNYAPRALGSAASPLLRKLGGNHHDVRLTPHEQTMMRLWIETGAPDAGTYAALGTGMIGAYREDVLDRSDAEWPAVQAARTVLNRRCGSCHNGPRKLPESPSDDLGMPPWQSNLADPRTRFSRHLLYNPSRPEKSLLLLAPLAKEAGGAELCAGVGQTAAITFATTTDPDYRTLLESILAAKRALEEMKRFDMPGFRPRPEYRREMVHFGILPSALGPDALVDVYATDRAYWESLWHRGFNGGL
jgi:hypothetical protein